jgi:long-chain acyl-CoA synthetase
VGIDLRRPLFRAVREELGGNLRYIVCGGAFLEQKYADGMEAFGIRVLNGYGITECAPVVAVNRSGQVRSHSVGLPLPGCEVRIRDGEICVRGDNVMAGYFEDEAGTKEVMEDEWFHTGDLGHFDGDGFLYITGRKKNLIILSNGENVSAEELEEKILEIQGVEEVVVSQENNVITAEIYAKDQTGIDEAVEALNRRLPSYKRIGKTKYRQCEFERTTSQKIKRYYTHKAET